MNVYALVAADCLIGRLIQCFMKERCFNSGSDLNFTSKNSSSKINLRESIQTMSAEYITACGKQTRRHFFNFFSME